VAGVEQSLRRDAAYVEAGTAQAATALYACDLQAKLASFDGSYIAPRTPTNDDDVLLLVGGKPT